MIDRDQIIMKHFPSDNSWEENYRKIIELGKKLEQFNEEDKQDKWFIKGCQSPLWLKVERSGSGNLIFSGDSEGLITKGILALVIEFYTDKSPEKILKEKPLFIEKLELNQFLSSRRTNGLQALLDQILQYAKVFLLISKPS